MISLSFSNMAAAPQQLAVAVLFLFGGVLSFPLGQQTEQTAACGYEVSCVHGSAAS